MPAISNHWKRALKMIFKESICFSYCVGSSFLGPALSTRVKKSMLYLHTAFLTTEQTSEVMCCTTHYLYFISALVLVENVVFC